MREEAGPVVAVKTKTATVISRSERAKMKGNLRSLKRYCTENVAILVEMNQKIQDLDWQKVKSQTGYCRYRCEVKVNGDFSFKFPCLNC